MTGIFTYTVHYNICGKENKLSFVLCSNKIKLHVHNSTSIFIWLYLDVYIYILNHELSAVATAILYRPRGSDMCYAYFCPDFLINNLYFIHAA